MAVIVPIVSKFDDKGIKKAQSEFGKLGSSMKGLLATAGLAVGLAAVTNGLKEASKAAIGDVKSQALLAAQLKNTVGATQEQTAAVEQSIQKMQLMAGVADDDIRPAFASLLRSTKDIGQATTLTGLALDVAAGTGKDLGAVSLALGKAVNGSNTSLLKLIPSLKGAKDPMAELQKQFGGMAATAANADPFQRISIIFQDIQEQIGMQLLPSLQELATWLASDTGQAEIGKLVDIFKDLAKAVGDSIGWLVQNIELVKQLAGLTAIVTGLGLAFNFVSGAINIATASAAALNAVPMVGIISSIAVITAGLVGLGIAAFDANNNVAKMNSTYYGAGSSRGANYQAETRKNRAAANRYAGMEAMGAALGLNKANDPFAVIPTLPVVPTTPTGAKSTAAKAAADKAAKARQAIIDAAQKASDDAKEAFIKMRDAAKNFSDSFKEVAKTFTDTFKASAEIGAFEQQTIDAFDAIKQSAIDASKAGLFDAKTLDGLLAYADREKALLQGIAKQRDVLAKKISIAQSITSGVMGSLNITSMLETQTKQVTKSVSSMVNGIALTTTQTFDEVVSGGLADSFKKLVDKTKTFASNLTKLKTLGLNGNLFKQIVEAGAESGNATAEAIIAGGADAVKELNGLFTELTDAGADIAKTSTPILYDLGENMTNSFIDGLRSQDQVLIDSANAMAALFTEQFKSQLNLAIAPTVTAAQQTGIQMQTALDLSKRPDPVRSPQSYANWLSSIGGIDPVRSPQSYAAAQAANTYNVVINAGAITDQAALPTLVTNALVTATKQGLTGGLSRLLAV